MAAIWQCPNELISSQIHAVRILIRSIPKPVTPGFSPLSCSSIEVVRALHGHEHITSKQLRDPPHQEHWWWLAGSRGD